MAKKKTSHVDPQLLMRALEMATSSVFTKVYHGGYSQMGGHTPPHVHQNMTDDEAIARAKKFLAWLTGA